jgi:hypothetical protein
MAAMNHTSLLERLVERSKAAATDLRDILDWARFLHETESPHPSRLEALKDGYAMHRFTEREAFVHTALASPAVAGKCDRYIVLANHASDAARVVLILRPGQEQKYLRGTDAQGREIIVSIPVEMHYEIRRALEKHAGVEMTPRGGGWLIYEDGILRLSRQSGDYGRANHAEVACALQQIGLKTHVED